MSKLLLVAYVLFIANFVDVFHGIYIKLHWSLISAGGCGSGGRAVAWQSEGCRVDPILGVSKCPWASLLTPNCSWWAGWYLAWQPIAVDVWVCVNGWMRGINCKALWIKALYAVHLPFNQDYPNEQHPISCWILCLYDMNNFNIKLLYSNNCDSLNQNNIWINGIIKAQNKIDNNALSFPCIIRTAETTREVYSTKTLTWENVIPYD